MGRFEISLSQKSILSLNLNNFKEITPKLISKKNYHFTFNFGKKYGTSFLENISVGLGPARASPRAFFTARPETGPGRAVKNPARARAGLASGRGLKARAGPGQKSPGQPAGFLDFFQIFVLGLVRHNLTFFLS